MHSHDHKACCKGSCGKRLVGVVSGVLFGLMAVCHILRLTMGWSTTFNGEEIPLWVSIVSIVVSGAMSVWNFCSCCCCNKKDGRSCSVTSHEHTPVVTHVPPQFPRNDNKRTIDSNDHQRKNNLE